MSIKHQFQQCPSNSSKFQKGLIILMWAYNTNHMWSAVNKWNKVSSPKMNNLKNRPETPSSRSKMNLCSNNHWCKKSISSLQDRRLWTTLRINNHWCKRLSSHPRDKEVVWALVENQGEVGTMTTIVISNFSTLLITKMIRVMKFYQLKRSKKPHNVWCQLRPNKDKTRNFKRKFSKVKRNKETGSLRLSN